MASDVAVRIRAFIKENFMMMQGAAALSNDESFLEAGIIDSTGVLELIGFLEEAFGIQVADEEMLPTNLDSIANLERYIERKRA